MEKILAKRTIVKDCWLFIGNTDENGYSYIHLYKKYKRCGIHRISAVVFKNINIDKCHVCHLNICRFKGCFNPEHLYAGDQKTNCKDAIEAGRFYFPYLNNYANRK